MKKENAFAKKAVLIASLTAGVIGLHSIFNDAQSSGGSKTPVAYTCYSGHGIHSFWGTICEAGSSSCIENPC